MMQEVKFQRMRSIYNKTKAEAIVKARISLTKSHLIRENLKCPSSLHRILCFKTSQNKWIKWNSQVPKCFCQIKLNNFKLLSNSLN